MIYFIKCGEYIKIGYSHDPHSRLKDLQVGNPEMLSLIGTMRGHSKDEQKMHGRFKHLHYRGEWFKSADELLRFIGENKMDATYDVTKREAVVEKQDSLCFYCEEALEKNRAIFIELRTHIVAICFLCYTSHKQNSHP